MSQVIKDVRICYENGIEKKGNEIYEMHAWCDCSGCNSRWKMRTGLPNTATATTRDVNKIKEIKLFLKNWSCADQNKYVPTEYFQF